MAKPPVREYAGGGGCAVLFFLLILPVIVPMLA